MHLVTATNSYRLMYWYWISQRSLLLISIWFKVCLRQILERLSPKDWEGYRIGICNWTTFKSRILASCECWCRSFSPDMSRLTLKLRKKGRWSSSQNSAVDFGFNLLVEAADGVSIRAVDDDVTPCLRIAAPAALILVLTYILLYSFEFQAKTAKLTTELDLQ